MTMTRRTFVLESLVGTAALAATGLGHADAKKVLESDPQAVALGYKEDATKVDKAKFPKYVAGEKCASCQLYSGKVGAAAGPCAIFGGKDVKAAGWCSAYAKRA